VALQRGRRWLSLSRHAAASAAFRSALLLLLLLLLLLRHLIYLLRVLLRGALLPSSERRTAVPVEELFRAARDL
jgi:hypothetical protein